MTALPEPPLTPEEQVAANVKLLRTRRGYTQSELADRLGMKWANVVWSVEVGKRRITVNDLSSFADALGVPPYLLLAENSEPERASLEAARTREQYQSYVQAGFTEEQALELTKAVLVAGVGGKS
ncbi:helix-turn-helix domain-containing protein [Streptomyces sp. NPDC102415]|uniref:helix-turn-helix domain-containing protein n=1 Tax=Streptomyces sp. NPDC102415 TaxID=3366173 RepID=UPI00381732C7